MLMVLMAAGCQQNASSPPSTEASRPPAGPATVFDDLGVAVDFDSWPWKLERMTLAADHLSASGAGTFDPIEGRIDLRFTASKQALARAPELDLAFHRCAADPTRLGRGPDFALYLLLDAFIDVHYTLVDALTEHIDAFADEVSGPEGVHEQEQMLDGVVAARRAHAVLRRRLAPQREVFLALARPGQALVKEQTALYFRDLVDHSVRLTEEVDTGRELLASLMDVLLSRTNNRLSAVTARLTLIATIFLPLNFLAGFFGMNLEIVHPHVAIPLVLGAMVALPVAMVAWFRRQRWL